MTHLNKNTLAEQPALDYLRNLGYEIEEGKHVSPGSPYRRTEQLSACRFLVSTTPRA